MLFVLALTAVALFDHRRRRIPHWATLPAAATAVLWSAALPAGFRLNALLGGLLCGGVTLGVWAAARRIYGPGALGGGDVGLAVLLGSLGGVTAGLGALAGGMLLAGGAALWQMLGRSAERRARLPFGFYWSIAGVGLLLCVPPG